MTVGILLSGPKLVVSPAFLLGQLVIAFQSNLPIRAGSQQLMLWAELGEPIAPLLEELVRRGLAEPTIGGGV